MSDIKDSNQQANPLILSRNVLVDPPILIWSSTRR